MHGMTSNVCVSVFWLQVAFKLVILENLDLQTWMYQYDVGQWSL